MLEMNPVVSAFMADRQQGLCHNEWPIHTTRPPGAARPPWFHVFACWCFVLVSACGCLWVLGLCGCLSLLVVACVKWLPLVALGKCSVAVAKSSSQVAKGTIMIVMAIRVITIISIETIITMVRQNAGSLLPSLPCHRPNITRGASQPTSVLWPLAP